MKTSAKVRCGRISKINYSPDSLAYIGDAVFELLVRDLHIKERDLKAGALHKKTVAVVNAGSQARLADMLQDIYTDEEKAIYKRGRNAAVSSLPKNARLSEYCRATGFEAVFGYHYINGDLERIKQLFDYCMRGMS